MTNCSNHRKLKGGAVRMPSEYFGKDSGRYLPAGSKELAVPSCQRPASFGTIFADGTVGPVLRTQVGGNRKKKSHSKRYRKSKSKKSSTRMNLKTMRQKLATMSKRLSLKMKKMKQNVSMSL